MRYHITLLLEQEADSPEDAVAWAVEHLRDRDPETFVFIVEGEDGSRRFVAGEPDGFAAELAAAVELMRGGI